MTSLRAYYNEIDSDAADQIRGLIAAGLIPDGLVDQRSIEDIAPNELLEYNQLHFFAGIAGWAYALDLAGWPQFRPCITGSCPCQPFSSAGSRNGFNDERHLWPAFWHIIRELRRAGHPAAEFVMGEQVASGDGLRWLDLVFDDLESENYAARAIDTCSAGYGAPHIRQRVYWCGVGMADTANQRHTHRNGIAGVEGGRSRSRAAIDGCGVPQRMAAATNRHRHSTHTDGCTVRLANANSGVGGQGHSLSGGRDSRGHAQSRPGPVSDGVDCRPGPTNGLWRAADWLHCRDDKWRPVEPGSFPLAHGLPRSMGALGPELSELARVAGLSRQSLAAAKRFRVRQLRGYGNAINPWQAAEFVRAAMDMHADTDCNERAVA